MKGPDDPEPDHPAPMLPYVASAGERMQFQLANEAALADATFWRDQAVRLYAQIHKLQLPLRREQIIDKLLRHREAQSRVQETLT